MGIQIKQGDEKKLAVVVVLIIGVIQIISWTIDFLIWIIK